MHITNRITSRRQKRY